MAEKIITNKQGVKISHANYVTLRNKNLIKLGIEDDLSTKLAGNSDIVPTKTTAVKAFHFWNWIAVICFFVSIYWTFTAYWWSFIAGFVVMRFLWKVNKKSNSENFLDAAMVDKEFYEKVMKIEGWIYQIDDSNMNHLKEILVASIQKVDVVSDFVNQFSKLDMLTFWDETNLCHPKVKIQEALLNEIKACTDETQKEHLKVALIYTCQFIKDLGEPVQLYLNQQLEGLNTQEMTQDELKDFATSYIESKPKNNDEKYHLLAKQSEAEYAQLITRLN